MAGQDFNELIFNLKSDDEKLRKNAISKVSNMNFSKVPKEDLAKIAFYVKEIGDDPNLTIRYFAKKATKRIGGVDDFDALVKQGAELSGSAFQKSLAKQKSVEQKPKTITEMQETIEETAPEPVCPGCGFLNLTTSKFCSECGVSMSQEAKIINEEPVAQMESIPDTGITDGMEDSGITPAKLPEYPDAEVKPKKKYAAAEKKGKLPKKKKIQAGAGDAKQESKLVKVFNVLIYLAALAFCGYTAYEKFNSLGAGPIFTKCLYTQIVAGNLILLILTMVYFRKFWGIKALNKVIYGSILFSMAYTFYRLNISAPESISILSKDASILMNLFFPIVSIIALFIIWGKPSGKAVKYYKLLLTILVLYSLAAFVPFFKDFKAPFTDNIISYDNEFLKSTTFLNSYMKPLWLEINVLLPLVVLILLLRSLITFFRFRLKEFVGHVLSLVLILTACIYGAVLFEAGGIKNHVKPTEKPKTVWTGVEFLAEKGKLKMISYTKLVEFISGSSMPLVTINSDTSTDKSDSVDTPDKTDTKVDDLLDKIDDTDSVDDLNVGLDDDTDIDDAKAVDDTGTDVKIDEKSDTKPVQDDAGKSSDAAPAKKGLNCSELCEKLQLAYDEYDIEGGEVMKKFDINKLSKYLKSYDIDANIKCPNGGEFIIELEQIKCSKCK